MAVERAVPTNFVIISALLFFILFFSSCTVAQQLTNNQIDSLLGEWVGERTNPRVETEKITLVINKSLEGELIGTFTSEQSGNISQQAVKINITKDSNGRTVLEFEKEVNLSPRRYASYRLTLISKNYLKGTSSGVGSTSTVELTHNLVVKQ